MRRDSAVRAAPASNSATMISKTSISVRRGGARAAAAPCTAQTGDVTAPVSASLANAHLGDVLSERIQEREQRLPIAPVEPLELHARWPPLSIMRDDRFLRRGGTAIVQQAGR